MMFNPRKHRRKQARQRAALAALAALTGAAGLAAPAQAGTFQVSQCNKIGDGLMVPAGFQASVWSQSGQVATYSEGCDGTGRALDSFHPNRRLYADEHANRHLNLPSSMPNTTISGMNLAFTAYQRSGSSVNPPFFIVSTGATTLFSRDQGVGTHSDSGTTKIGLPAGTRGLNFNEWCSPVNGPGYCHWDLFSNSIKGLTLTLEENVLPSANASGALLSGGQQAGTRALDVTATDADSGIKKVDVTLDGAVVGSFDFAASCKIDRFSPCDQSVLKQIDVDTTKVPDGSRLLRVVTTDLAGNSRTVDKGYITVENVPAPAATQIPTISGEKRINRALTGTQGSWTGANLSYSYRWQRYVDGTWEPIPDATTLNFTTTKYEVGARLRLKVTASNVEGSTVAFSDETNPILAAGVTDNDGDYDNDGTENGVDGDDDNDGLNDADDLAPFDSSNPKDAPKADFDGDGVPNDVDTDDDNDGVSDAEDSAPFNPAIGTAPTGTATIGQPPASSTTNTTNNTTTNSVFGTVPNGKNHSVRAVTKLETASTRNVSYGKPTLIKGKLLDENGKAISGAAITVSERSLIPGSGFAEGSAMAPVGTITTAADGSFSYTAKAGPSRTVQFGYKAFKDAGEFSRISDVSLLVSGKATLKSSKKKVRNGQSVKFSGTIATPAPAAGVQVELQAKTARGWMTFKTTRAKSNGRYSATYRFTRTTGTQTYQFRAKVKTDSHYGYKATTAKTITVRVSR